MLTDWDDLPLHQTTRPLAEPSTADPARYERFFLAAFEATAGIHVGVVVNVHPNLGMVDAAVSVSREDQQVSLQAAAGLGDDRSDLHTGPIRYRIIDPMRRVEVRVDDGAGLSVDLNVTARSAAAEETRVIRHRAGRAVQDRSRYVQSGRATGSLTVDGRTVEVADWRVVRDHSWGVWDAPKPHAYDAKPSAAWFAWTVLEFDDELVQAVVHEDPYGDPYGASAVAVPLPDPADPVTGSEVPAVNTAVVSFDVAHQPGTRRACEASLRTGPRGRLDRAIALEPVHTVLARGVGYGSPGWHSGDVDTVGRSRRREWSLKEVDPLAPENLYTQQIIRARRADGAVGWGLMDHCARGVHLPSGLTDPHAPAENAPAERT